MFGPGGFEPARDTAPFTAISQYAKGQLFVIGTTVGDGWAYRIDYPYYSWAETVVRPRITRHDLTGYLSRLNELEKGDGQWKSDSGELSSAIKFLSADGRLATSSLVPEQVAELLDSFLSSRLELSAH